MKRVDRLPTQTLAFTAQDVNAGRLKNVLYSTTRKRSFDFLIVRRYLCTVWAKGSFKKLRSSG